MANVLRLSTGLVHFPRESAIVRVLRSIARSWCRASSNSVRIHTVVHSTSQREMWLSVGSLLSLIAPHGWYTSFHALAGTNKNYGVVWASCLS